MSEAKPAENEQDHTQDQEKNLPLVIHGQYVHDISFENPHAPESLKAGLTAPKTNMRFGVGSSQVEGSDIERLHEVKLNVTAEAVRDEQAIFIAEVQYCVLVSIDENIDEEMHKALLLIEVPRMAFPFVRQIIADVTAQGGYPPLFITPVDFRKLYENRTGKTAPKI